MIAAWMLVSLAVALPLAGAAWCADRLAAAHRRARRLPWAVALAGLLALTALAPLRREAAMPALALPAAAAPATTATVVDGAPWYARLPRALADVAGDARATIAAAAARAATVDARVQRTLAGAWGAATLAVLATLAVAWRRMARARRTWPRAEIDGVAVRVARGGPPAVVGLGRTMEIVVPAWVTALPPARRALVLAHERQHVHARDPWLLALGAATVALLPWHPVAWWLAARLATAIETDCDARVLAAGADVRDYGALLLDVAAGRCAPSLLAPWPALGGRRSTLETRIRAMTHRHRSPRALLSAATGAAIVACTVVACDSGKLPTSAEVERMDARTLARAVDALPLAGGDSAQTPSFTIDGKPATRLEAEAIGADRIAAMDVRRFVLADGTVRKNVTIWTKEVTRPVDPARDGIAQSVAVMRGGVRDTVVATQFLSDPAAGRVMFRVDGRPGDTVSTPRLVVATPQGSVATPVYFIDNVKADAEAIRRLVPDRVVSVEVLKGAAATQAYGAEGANGVIRITTRK